MSKIEVNQISSQCGSTLTIGQSGDTVTLACGASQTGFGRTGTVDWDTTAKVNTDSPVTAVSGTGYFLNTTSGAITVNLPAGSAGSIVSLKDYANTWNTNAVTVAPNGSDKINGENESAILSTQDQSVTLVYVDSTKGWRAVQDSTSDVTGTAFVTATGGTITTCGDYKIHTFTSPGTFCVSCAGNASGSNSVDYVVVGGGGGGSGTTSVPCCGYSSGGGGAGGFRESHCSTTSGCYTASPLASATSIPVGVSAYPITVGAGGSAGPSSTPTIASNGSPSTFSTITSAGGGYGARGGGNNPCQPGGPGGSGGGSGAFGHITCTPAVRNPGGTGNTPPVAPPQGNPGGKGTYQGATGAGGGGGAIAGGASATRVCSPPCTTAGDGGAGVTTAIPGTPTAYAGGGGGANGYFCSNAGIGGSGDGGLGGGGAGGSAICQTNSAIPVPQQGAAGTANTGGGGGGTQSWPGTARSGNAGGSGIVIIRYKYQ